MDENLGSLEQDYQKELRILFLIHGTHTKVGAYIQMEKKRDFKLQREKNEIQYVTDAGVAAAFWFCKHHKWEKYFQLQQIDKRIKRKGIASICSS